MRFTKYIRSGWQLIALLLLNTTCFVYSFTATLHICVAVIFGIMLGNVSFLFFYHIIILVLVRDATDVNAIDIGVGAASGIK